jgi:hypothetical protein
MGINIEQASFVGKLESGKNERFLEMNGRDLREGR